MSGRFKWFSCWGFFLDSLDFCRLSGLGVEIVLKFQKEILTVEELIKELVRDSRYLEKFIIAL